MKKLLFTIVLLLSVFTVFGQTSDYEKLDILFSSIMALCNGDKQVLATYLKSLPDAELGMYSDDKYFVLDARYLIFDKYNYKINYRSNSETNKNEVIVLLDFFMKDMYDFQEHTYEEYIYPYTSLVKYFGEPSINVDKAFYTNRSDSNVIHHMTADWFIGEYRMRYNNYIFNTYTGFTETGGILSILPRSEQADLIDLVPLRFIGENVVIHDTNTSYTISDNLVMVLDFNIKELLFDNYRTVGKIVSQYGNIVECLISNEEKSTYTKVFLDRLFGTYRMEYYINERALCVKTEYGKIDIYKQMEKLF